MSLVIATRNDTDDALRRTQFFVRNVIDQCDRFELPAEIIVVDWNTPAGNRSIAASLVGIEASDRCTIRVIRVPDQLHEMFANAERLAMYQMIAKNTGIRRATGRFVLATNIDIVFSDRLWRCLSRRSLDSRCIYRVNMAEVPRTGLDIDVGAALQAWCSNHVTRIYARFGTVAPAGMLRAKLRYLALDLPRSKYPVHTNACGDFTLLSRTAWHELRGYAEYPIMAAKIDGLLCHAAACAGYREKVLGGSQGIYHIEHGARTDGMSTEVPAQHSQESRPLRLDFRQYQAIVDGMRNGDRSHLLNDDDSWGLRNELLETVTLLA